MQKSVSSCPILRPAIRFGYAPNCLQDPDVLSASCNRAEEIRGNLDRMGIPHTVEQIDKMVHDAEKRRRIEGVSDGPAEFYNDKVTSGTPYSACLQ